MTLSVRRCEPELPLDLPEAFFTGLFESALGCFVGVSVSSDSDSLPLPVKCLDLRVLEERVNFRTGFLACERSSESSESRLPDLVGVLLFTAFLVAAFFAGGLESSEESLLSESLEESSSLLELSLDELDESSESSLSELLEELLWLAT